MLKIGRALTPFDIAAITTRLQLEGHFNNGLELLTYLQNNGHASETNLAALRELLEEIGRERLVADYLDQIESNS